MDKYQHASAVAASAARHVTHAAKTHAATAHTAATLVAHHAKTAAQAASTSAKGFGPVWLLLIPLAMLIAAALWPSKSKLDR
jgi:hypothetical protein